MDKLINYIVRQDADIKILQKTIVELKNSFSNLSEKVTQSCLIKTNFNRFVKELLPVKNLKDFDLMESRIGENTELEAELVSFLFCLLNLNNSLLLSKSIISNYKEKIDLFLSYFNCMILNGDFMILNDGLRFEKI